MAKNKRLQKFKEKTTKPKQKLTELERLVVLNSSVIDRLMSEVENLRTRLDSMDYYLDAMGTVLNKLGVQLDFVEVVRTAKELQFEDFKKASVELNKQEGLKDKTEPVADGDVVMMKMFVCGEDGQPVGDFGYARIQIGAGKFKKEIEMEVIGMKNGDTKAVISPSGQKVFLELYGVYSK